MSDETAGSGKSDTMGGDALVGLMEKPQKMLENALTTLTKKAITTLWGRFKRQLSTASEPFLRKDMGERYLSSEGLAGGLGIWLTALIFALVVPSLRSAASFLFEAMSWYGLAHLFQFWLFPLVIGAMLIVFHLKFGKEGQLLMAKYRENGTAYHTMSRGIPRWGENNSIVTIGIAIVLFLFDLPACILFVASCAMSAKLAGEQQAAIYGRYLDALDQKIEQEYLESAILGKCPTEITQLTQPLPAAMNADLRNNIAAAAVGKSVKIVAKGPKSSPPISTESGLAQGFTGT